MLLVVMLLLILLLILQLLRIIQVRRIVAADVNQVLTLWSSLHLEDLNRYTASVSCFCWPLVALLLVLIFCNHLLRWRKGLFAKAAVAIVRNEAGISWDVCRRHRRQNRTRGWWT